ncbi:MAG TPA: hypothetical protein VG714_06265 [Acidobacteriaceae bacterium]|nr:hypothetical protein [Acidobacteriaceae bacterium]
MTIVTESVLAVLDELAWVLTGIALLRWQHPISRLLSRKHPPTPWVASLVRIVGLTALLLGSIGLLLMVVLSIRLAVSR